MTKIEKELVRELCIQVKYATVFEGSPVFDLDYLRATVRIEQITEDLGLDDNT